MHPCRDGGSTVPIFLIKKYLNLLHTRYLVRFFDILYIKQYVYRIPFLFRWGGGFLWGLRTCNRSITATYCCFCRKKVGSTTDAPEVHMIRAAAAYYTFMAKGATGYTATRRVFYTSLSCIISTVCMITCNTNRACILG